MKNCRHTIHVPTPRSREGNAMPRLEYVTAAKNTKSQKRFQEVKGSPMFLSQLQSVPAEALIQADHVVLLVVYKRANTAPEDLFKTSSTTKMTTDTKISDLKLAWRKWTGTGDLIGC